MSTLVPATFASSEARGLAMRRLAEVEPRGCTDLHAGWNAAATQLADHLAKESVNRVLLLTDGLANHGVTDHIALVSHSGELRRRGIATTTFGVGADFDERLLRDISHEGGGQFYFIETPAQIADLLTSELGEALEVVRRDVALQIALPAGAEAEPLNRYRFTHVAGDNELRVDLGDLTAGQELCVVIRIRFPRGENGTTTEARVSIAGADALALDERASLTWSYASHADNDGQSRDRVVDREVARLYVTRARAEATEANRNGDFERARRVLDGTASRIHGYTFGDPELQRLRQVLRAEMRDYTSGPMSALALKSAFFVAESAGKNRGPEGKARRARP